ncbi:hypothetical protein [Globicatella sp. PHS-GS-PNBC-21-1553]|uniref:hypothetical protein n=1 Tax=Globicatella sp. PHS-GS-PNBC-21-1553 TaxID=2885764 RepID=UPI00298ED80D|nr:hypothetical protein [Globicatella sp. PHS-GS-PNBC-21-1553]WPC07859.1 hypothetical protein LB888_07200 [Globicatella sp. PHS-GS-PNBC-21-1553]
MKHKYTNLGQILWQLTLLFVLLVALYFSLMVLSYTIPIEKIEVNLRYSLETIASETKRWSVMGEFKGTKLDTFTDNLIFNKLTNQEELSAIQAAMWNNGYERYWLGDIAVLRPMLMFMSYKHIRYLNIFLVFIVFYFSMTKVEKAISRTYAYLLMTMLLLIHFWIFPLSLQYTPVFIISLLGIVAVIEVHQRYAYRFSKMVLLFFTIGSVTNFFDLLTVPLLTFALPWMIYFVLVNQHHRRHFKHNLSETVILGWTWLMGFGLTWASKWAIGSVILKDNSFANVANQIALRTGGKTDEVLDAIEIIKNMWKILLPKTAIIILFIWLIILLVQSFKGVKSYQYWLSTTPLLMVALVPFVWVFILKNHNFHHAYFTYRLFIITLFSVYTYLYLNLKQRNE